MRTAYERSTRLFIFILLFYGLPALNASTPDQSETAGMGIQGDPEAVSTAYSLVEAMGGKWLWSSLRTLRFENRWWYVGVKDVMMQTEILDLVEPNTYVEVRSEVYLQRRATSRKSKWIIRNGDYQESNAVAGSGRNIYRIVRRIAADDPSLEVRLTKEYRLEFYDSAQLLCWIVVDARGEPTLWGTPEVEYVFGPLTNYGSVRLPLWGYYSNGEWRYQMIDASGSREAPDVSFDPPPGARAKSDSAEN